MCPAFALGKLHSLSSSIIYQNLQANTKRRSKTPTNRARLVKTLRMGPSRAALASRASNQACLQQKPSA